MKTDMEYIKNHDTSFCATACLSMICKHYKKVRTITQIRQSFGTNTNNTTLKNFENGANILGFETKNTRMNFELLNSKFTLPAVVHTITQYGCGNFITVIRIINGMVKYFDPLKGENKVSISEFYINYPGILLLLSPSNEFNKIETISTQKETAIL